MIKNLRCEYRKNPIGIDVFSPRFTWTMEGEKQTAFQLIIDGLWDSGIIRGSQNRYKCTDKLPLQPFSAYTYQLKVWNEAENVCCESGSFETGFLGEENIQAEWITVREEHQDLVPVFFKSFSIQKKVAKVRLYATTLGVYEAVFNGKRVGDSYLAPGYTSYHKHLQYQVYELENVKAENKIEFYVGKGWCRGRFRWQQDVRNTYTTQYGLLAQVVIFYEDNTTQVVGTDLTWRYADSRIVYSEIYDGEEFDAAKKINQEFQAALLSYPKKHLTAQSNEPVRAVRTCRPVDVFHTPSGETVLDFGQNMAGMVEFRVVGKRGDVVELSFAEILDANGNFYTENMRTAKNKIIYHLSGEGVEIYRPHFTYQGFRYVRIDRYPGEVRGEQFRAIVLSSDLERIGTFSCADSLLNQLYQNAFWGQIDNFLDIPADCPQRDERMGWTGDAQIFSKTASMNMHTELFFEKWLTDLALDQRENGAVPDIIPFVDDTHECAAGWGDAVTIIPWTVYQEYGEIEILRKQYDSMKRWVSYLRQEGENEYLWNTGFHYGDWLALDAEEGSYDGLTRKDLLASAFYAHSVWITAQTAKVLGKEQESAAYTALFEKIRDAFQAEFVCDGELISKTQTAYAVALHFKLVPGTFAKQLAELVRANGTALATGFLGTPYILHALSDHGYADLAYQLLLRKEYPSWLYPVTQGATTIWEHWDGMKPDHTLWSSDMNSFNHYAYGAVVDWMYTKMCGILPAAAGYQSIKIAPLPTRRVSGAHACLQSPYGQIQSKWTVAGCLATHTVTIPFNTEAVFEMLNGEIRKLQPGINVLVQTIPEQVEIHE